MTFTIHRDRWVRGQWGSTLIRWSDGHPCALGFFLLACGMTEEAIRPYPDTFELPRIPAAAAFLLRPSRPMHKCWAKVLMAVNDDEHISESVRERRLTDLFAQNGVQVQFV
jgi:hypothetical protein